MQKMGTKDGIEVILRRFGDEQSTLLDQFERLSFEVQLNQAILGRSLSEPSVSRSNHPPPPPLRKTKAPPPPSPHPMASQVQQGQRRGLGFKNVLKRLLKPILSRRGGGKKEVPDPKDPRSWKRFSRSMRV